MNIKAKIISLLICLCLLLCACTPQGSTQAAQDYTNYPAFDSAPKAVVDSSDEFDFAAIPEFNNQPYVVINDNKPDFTEDDYTTESFENYGELDRFGRCTVCFACVGKDLMPTDDRESIGSIKPTGWHTVKYDCIDGKYLYNRCHLIGYQLTAENSNPYNLITGTRYLNVDGMLPFEDLVASYVKATDNHVLYRVTPHFKDNELIARGVQIEGYSVEDNGSGICFNVYCYNNQPYIEIDYSTGGSSLSSEYTTVKDDGVVDTYIVNMSSKKFHKTDCSAVAKISDDNKKKYTGSRTSLINNGYEPCKQCNP